MNRRAAAALAASHLGLTRARCRAVPIVLSLALVGAAFGPVGVAGAVVPKCHGTAATIVGTSGDDRLVGTSDRDVIVARGGDDRIDGARMGDVICGGRGHDTIIGGHGTDVLVGGRGNDRLLGGESNDTFYPGRGDDRVHGGVPRSTSVWWQHGPVDLVVFEARRGGHGVRANLAEGVARIGDTTDRMTYVEAVRGTPNDDVIIGSSAANRLYGRGGDDVLTGRGGVELLEGGQGDDVLTGDAGSDYFLAGPGDDTFKGGKGSDFLFYDDWENGYVGAPALFYWGHPTPEQAAIDVDLATGRAVTATGRDEVRSIRVIHATAYNDILQGSDGYDVLYGGSGSDELYGRGGDDYLSVDDAYPDDANDTINGGDGHDRCLGGGEADTVSSCEEDH